MLWVTYFSANQRDISQKVCVWQRGVITLLPVLDWKGVTNI